MGAAASVSSAAVREAVLVHTNAALPDGSPELERYRAVFGRFDSDHDGVISAEEFAMAVRALGASEWSEHQISRTMSRMDLTGSLTVSFEEFILFLNPAEAPELLPVSDARLNAVFLEFASFGSRDISHSISRRNFVKMLRDTGVMLDEEATAVDLLFSETVIPGLRSITFEQFLPLVPRLARERFPDADPARAEALVRLMLAAGVPRTGTSGANTPRSGSPVEEGTRRRQSIEAELGNTEKEGLAATKLVSLLSEAHVLPPQAPWEPPALAAPTEAGASGEEFCCDRARALAEQELAKAISEPPPSGVEAKEDGGDHDTTDDEDESHPPSAEDMEAVEATFLAYCAFGAREGPQRCVDGSRFMKLVRECRLLSKRFTSADADLLFTANAGSAPRRLDFETFWGAVAPAIAAKKYPGVAPQRALLRLVGRVVNRRPQSTRSV